MACVILILVDFELSVHFALQLTDISFVPEMLDCGQAHVLDIYDGFGDTIFNLFWHFDPAIGTEFLILAWPIITINVSIVL